MENYSGFFYVIDNPSILSDYKKKLRQREAFSIVLNRSISFGDVEILLISPNNDVIEYFAIASHGNAVALGTDRFKLS